MRAFEKIKEKYKDGWWDGHDGYSPEDMYNDIEFLIGFGEESLNREAEQAIKINQLERLNQLLQYKIEVYEKALKELEKNGSVYAESLAKNALKNSHEI